MAATLTVVEKGRQYELLTLEFLLAQGLQLVECNYHGRRGELDLLMYDQAVLVVVEVRYRKNNRYGSAVESITPAKQRRIKITTEQYIQQHHIKKAIRFDVVAIMGTQLPEWIKNAF